jgi:hypothetical protein
VPRSPGGPVEKKTQKNSPCPADFYAGGGADNGEETTNALTRLRDAEAPFCKGPQHHAVVCYVWYCRGRDNCFGTAVDEIIVFIFGTAVDEIIVFEDSFRGVDVTFEDSTPGRLCR